MTIKSGGTYHFGVISCTPESVLTVNGLVQIQRGGSSQRSGSGRKNRGALPSSILGIVPFYGSLAALYFLGAALWGWRVAQFWESTITLQLGVFLALLLNLGYAILAFAYYLHLDMATSVTAEQVFGGIDNGFYKFTEDPFAVCVASYRFVLVASCEALITFLADGLFVTRQRLRRRTMAAVVVVVGAQLALLLLQHVLWAVESRLFEILSVGVLALWGGGLVAASLATWRSLYAQDEAASAAELRGTLRLTGNPRSEEEEEDEEEQEGVEGGGHSKALELSSASAPSSSSLPASSSLQQQQTAHVVLNVHWATPLKQRVFALVCRAVFLYPALTTVTHLFFVVFEDSYQWMWLRLVTFDLWMALAILAPATYHWIPREGGGGGAGGGGGEDELGQQGEDGWLDPNSEGVWCCCDSTGLGSGGGAGGTAAYAPLVQEMIHEMPEAASVMEMASVTISDKTERLRSLVSLGSNQHSSEGGGGPTDSSSTPSSSSSSSSFSAHETSSSLPPASFPFHSGGDDELRGGGGGSSCCGGASWGSGDYYDDEDDAEDLDDEESQMIV